MEFLVCDKSVVSAGQVVVDTRFNIEQGKSVAKVLSVYAKPYLTNCETVDNEVRYSGKVCFKLVYLSEENEVVALENISEFNEETKNELICSSSKCVVDFTLVDVTTPSIKTNEVRVACVLDVTLSLTKNNQMKCEIENEEEICTQKDVVEVWENVENFDEVFDLVDEIKVKDNMDKIICFDVNLCVKDSFASTGFVCVSGDVHYSFIYEKEEDGEKRLAHFSQVLPFKQEMSLPDSKKEDFFNVNLNINTSDIKVNVVLDNNSNIVKFETPVRVKGELLENKLVDCIFDAYMENYKTELKYEELSTITNPSKEVFESVEKGSFELSGEGEYSLIGYTSQSVTLSSVTDNERGVVVEGLVGVNVILSYEGSLTSINCEYPFKTEFNYENASNVKAELSLSDFRADLNGKMLNIECKVGYLISSFGKISKRYVSEIEVKEEKQKPDCALEIIFAKEKQSLFEIGKQFSVSEKLLLEQNKDITLPLKEGDKLVIYRQKIVEFN